MDQITIEGILKIYGILCLFSSPCSFLVLVYMIKKQPKAVTKFNDAIDKLVDGKKNEETENKPDTDKQPEPAALSKTIEEQNEDIGIATLNMFRADTYKCFLTTENIRNAGMVNVGSWKSSNPFVANFETKNDINIITAKKVGNAIICSGDMQIYHLNVKSKDESWWGHQHLDNLFRSVHNSNIKYKNRNRRFSKDSQNLRLLVMERSSLQPKTTYSWDSKGNVNLVVFEMNPNDVGHIATTQSMIEEYFEKIEIKEFPETSYWYHGTSRLLDYGDEDNNEQPVDFVAMFKKLDSGNIVFAVSAVWRQGADVTEVKNNPLMIDRCFENIIPLSEAVRLAVVQTEEKKIEKDNDNDKIPEKTQEDSDNSSAPIQEDNNEDPEDKNNETSSVDPNENDDPSESEEDEENPEMSNYEHEIFDPNDDDYNSEFDEGDEVDNPMSDPM